MPRLGFVVAAGVGTSISAHALEPYDVLVYSVGPVLIRPQFDFTETYSSNVFYSEDNPQDNFISYISPGIDLLLGRIEDNYVAFNYHATVVNYNQSEESEDDVINPIRTDDLNRVDNYLALGSRWEFNRVVVQGTSRVDFLGGLLGAGEGSFTRGNIDRVENAHNYSVGTKVTEKSKVTVSGNYYERDLEDKATLLDYSSWRAKLGYQYDSFSKTSLLGEVYYGEYETSQNSGLGQGGDAEALGAFIGATGEFTSKINGEVRVGYETRSARSTGTTTDSDGVVGEIALTYNISAKSVAQLAFERRFGLDISSQGSTQTTDELKFQFKQALGNSGKLAASFLALFQNKDFDGGFSDGRNDQFFVTGVGLDYNIQDWLIVGAGYNFTSFETDSLRYSDYDVHNVNVSLQIGY